MMIKKIVFLLLCNIAVYKNIDAQKIALLQVHLNKNDTSLIIPVKTDLDVITFLGDSSLALYAINGKSERQVAFQVYTDGQRWLCWNISNQNVEENNLIFELRNNASRSFLSTHPSNIKIKDSILTISAGNKALLSYVFKTWYPKTGAPAKDTVFGKSGFIHPLCAPHGQVLTRINPWDHYHHYGLWNPWTDIVFEGDTLDCWNLGNKKGTVRFSQFVSKTEGPVFSEYQALHEHVAFKKNGTQKVMLNEVQTVRIYAPDNFNDYYLANITIQLNCASESPVLLKEYSYGGLGWRATEEWTKDNSEVLTSEGKNRKDADGSVARWCIVEGALGNDHGGAVMMSYPANYNHPEPLRIWPDNIFNRGDMYANFCPVKSKDWLLLPGNTYLLRYQFVVFNGHYTKEKAEQAWQHFANPPVVTVKSINKN